MISVLVAAVGVLGRHSVQKDNQILELRVEHFRRLFEHAEQVADSGLAAA